MALIEFESLDLWSRWPPQGRSGSEPLMERSTVLADFASRHALVVAQTVEVYEEEEAEAYC